MSSFKGSYLYAVDSKGRVNLPVKLRKHISSEVNDAFVVTRGFDKCLFVYPMDEWNKFERGLKNLSPYDPDHRRFSRIMLDPATECSLDAQARLTIPPELRTYAEIKNEVRIIGILERIELWNPAIYEDYKNSSQESYESIAARVMRGT